MAPYFQTFGNRLMVFGAATLAVGVLGWLAGWLVSWLFVATPALCVGLAMRAVPGDAALDAGFEPNWMATRGVIKLVWMIGLITGVLSMMFGLMFALSAGG